jgi:putative acetyltransferase
MCQVIRFRRYHPDDAPSLAAIYREAVLVTGPAAYDPPQVAAWATYPDDLADFAEQLASGHTLVAVATGRPVAFGQLDPADIISFLYCLPDHSRQGIATAICQQLEEESRRCGQTKLETDASRISRPLFEKLGFEVAGSEHVTRSGTRIERFHMCKQLGPGT